MIEYLSLASLGAIPRGFSELMGGILLLAYLCYRWALPRPIPGIPCNNEATKTILGDLVPALEHATKAKDGSSWILEQNLKLQSPIVQLFVRPFRKSWVVITDFRETQDILLQRTKEFDRSQFFTGVFSGVLPQTHLVEKTNDKWKQHRRGIQNIMTPSFLEQVAGPQIYIAFTDLIMIWEEKSRLAAGHPFSASKDVYHATLDAIFAFMFTARSSNSTLRAQLEFVSSLERLDLPSNLEKEAYIPDIPDTEIVKSVITLVERSSQSAIPTLSHWLTRKDPYYRKAYDVKERFIKDEVDKTLQRFEGSSGDEKELTCALDEMVYRETLLSEKEGRAPMFHSRAMYDEIFGLVIFGHEKTSTTINWALKILADNPDVQSKLWFEIRTSFASAEAQTRAPSIQEITKTTIPYLDAVMEELLRCGSSSTDIIRTAMVDAEVLGHRIPKGTDVIMITNGPSFRLPSFKIDESLRSASSRTTKDTIGTWNPDDVADFKPERWLVGENSQVVFDASAGPQLAFGLGPRGCFGRKLAYLELRLALVLIMWSFELQQCPEELSSYAATDRMTHQPQQCYVRLRKL